MGKAQFTTTTATTCPCCLHQLAIDLDQTPPMIRLVVTPTMEQPCASDYAALRAELAAMKAKLAELDAALQAAQALAKVNRAGSATQKEREFFYGKSDGLDIAWRKLRELGLVEARDE